MGRHDALFGSTEETLCFCDKSVTFGKRNPLCPKAVVEERDGKGAFESRTSLLLALT